MTTEQEKLLREKTQENEKLKRDTEKTETMLRNAENEVGLCMFWNKK